MSENQCTQCGTSNAPDAKFCGSCGAALAPPLIGAATGTPPVQAGGTSNKALFSLILGILSLVCCGPLTGIPGAILGKMEMDAIKQGRAPETNLGMAKAGFWISIAGTILYVLMIILAVFFGLLANLPFLY